MAYNRKYRRYARRKAKGGKFMRYVNKGVGYAKTAYKAYQLASKVARMVNVEYKYFIIDGSPSVGNNGNIYPLCIVPQGLKVTERTGDSIKPMRLAGRVFITQHGSAQKTALRCILFRGKNENGTQYNVSDLLDTSHISTNQYLAPKDWNERFRTKIIYDKTFHLSNNGTSQAWADWNIKLFGHIQYVQEDATDIENGGLYMLLISNEPTNSPIFNYVLRLSFTDN